MTGARVNSDTHLHVVQPVRTFLQAIMRLLFGSTGIGGNRLRLQRDRGEQQRNATDTWGTAGTVEDLLFVQGGPQED